MSFFFEKRKNVWKRFLSGAARGIMGLKGGGAVKIRKLARMALLTAVALTIFLVEAQLPQLLPVPGVKLGLANIVTVYAVFTMGPGEAALILAARVLLGSIFSGQMMSLLYSAAGGVCAILVAILLRKILRKNQIFVAGILGSMAHCLGQMAVAVAVTATPGLAAYLPVMLACAMVTGLFTGLCAQFLAGRLGKITKKS